MGKPGMAILNYERARLLAPGDPDVEANLRFVRASANLPAETPDNFERIASMASPFWLSWIGVLGLSLAGASLIFAQLWSRHRLWRGAAALLGVAMVGLTLSNALMLWPRLHQGIVIAAATPVRVSPVPMGDPLFSLPEGEEVKVTAEHDGFALSKHESAGRVGFRTRIFADRAARALRGCETLIFRALKLPISRVHLVRPALGVADVFRQFCR